MTDGQSSKRRLSNVDDDLEQKHPKRPEVNEGNRGADDVRNQYKVLMDSFKLTDLHEYCLESIFEHLPIADLLILAESNEYFIGEACRATKRILRGNSVKIESSAISIENILLQKTVDYIKYVNSTETESTFLKHFGHLTSKLQLNDDRLGTRGDHRNTTLEYYIPKYCSKALIELHLNSRNRISMDNLSESFESLHVLNIFNASMVAIRHFDKWFPSLRCLLLHESNANLDEAFNLPKMETFLMVQSGFMDSESIDRLIDFLRLNPQLRDLTIEVNDHPY